MFRALPYVVLLVAALVVSSAHPAAAEPGDPAAVFESALAARDEGRLVLACRHFEQAVALAPAWPLAHYEYARCLRLIGDPEGLAAHHIARAEADLRRPPVFVEKGRIAEDAGDAEAALAAYDEAIALLPAEVRAQLGAARAVDPRRPDAFERLQQFVRRHPESAAGWRKLAEAAEHAGRPEEAERALRQAIEVSANKRAAIAALAAFGARAGRPAAIAEARRLHRSQRPASR